MSTLRVLLVDDDAWTEYVVISVLTKRGHQVHVAHSSAEAVNLVPDLLPSVLITEADLPSSPSGDEAARHPAATMVESLRRGGHLAETAILVLSALPAHDSQVQTIGGDGYLGKPFRFADLDRAVERAVQFQKRRLAAQVAPDLATERPMGSGISGSLDQLGLASLLTILEMERKTGILLVRRGSQSARLYCKEGRILAARLFGANKATATGSYAPVFHPEKARAAPPEADESAINVGMSSLEAVYTLLGFTDGHFNFTAMPVSVADEIGLRTTHLLLEGARRSDEARTQSD